MCSLGLSGCGSHSRGPRACEVAQALVGGSADADVLAVSSAQRRAIGRIPASGGPPGYFCSGAMVAPSWVLTAKHCDQGGSFTFETTDASGAAVSTRVIDTRTSDTDDVLLLKLEEPTDAEPLPLYAGSEDDRALIGAPVDLAGYGVDADGVRMKSLGFLAERIVRAEAEVLVVDGQGRTGACIGDSGGPMLLRDETGALVVAGTLSEGAGTCTGEDRYVRADRIRDWVLSIIGPVPGQVTCGAVTDVGFCRLGRAIWCDGGTLTARSCEAGASCGFSASSGGYRCLSPQDDVCDGVDDLGTCTGSRARVCVAGRIDETECSSCGGACAWDASTGRFDCVKTGPARQGLGGPQAPR